MTAYKRRETPEAPVEAEAEAVAPAPAHGLYAGHDAPGPDFTDAPSPFEGPDTADDSDTE